MNILFVYPEIPATFWSFKFALKIVGHKGHVPPLGAMTVAAMLPKDWHARLIDMNVCPLTDEDIISADYVFISAMMAQYASAKEVIARCKKLGVKTVGGGPLFFSCGEDFSEIDHMIIGEAEGILPAFLDDLGRGVTRQVYRGDALPDLGTTPLPLLDLIDLNDYELMGVQCSRGCPHTCEFCDVIAMNGRTPRFKSTTQIIAEFDALYDRGWRGRVFVMDDNFIGNRPWVKSLLRDIAAWRKRRGARFEMMTQASVDLAGDQELMDLMVAAGLKYIFLGIETPSKEALKECGKRLNYTTDLMETVRTIHRNGMHVMGGFIVGFDSDTADIFARQIEFIQNSGVVMAMIGVLQATPHTPLHARLQAEGRLLKQFTGISTDGSLNFMPKLDKDIILRRYPRILHQLYEPKMFYTRVETFFQDYQLRIKPRLRPRDVVSIARSLWFMGIVDGKEVRGQFWRFLWHTLTKRPHMLSDAMTIAVYGYHFRKFSQTLPLPPPHEDSIL